MLPLPSLSEKNDKRKEKKKIMIHPPNAIRKRIKRKTKCMCEVNDGA